MNILSLDIGASKIAATLAAADRRNISIIRETARGSSQLFYRIPDPASLVGEAIGELLQELKLSHDLRKTTAIVSLSGQTGSVIARQYPVKKHQHLIDKDLRAFSKDEVLYYLEPIIGKPEGDLVRVLYTAFPRAILRVVKNALASARIPLKKIYYALPLLGRYSTAAHYALINLGANTSEILIYHPDCKDRHIIPIGGEHILRDIRVACKISDHDARNRLFAYNQLFSSFFNRDQADTFSQAIDARVKELFRLIKAELEACGLEMFDEIVLSGGLAQLGSLSSYLQEYLDRRVIKLSDIALTALSERAPTPAENLMSRLQLEDYWQRFIAKRKWFG